MSGSFEIQLNSGRFIHLRELNQVLTYGDQIEGLPTKQKNKRLINHAQEAAVLPSRKAKREANVYLIPPAETVIEYRNDRPYPFGDPATLPAVQCTAMFLSHTPARDESQYLSWLMIVWYQERFALPLDQEIEAHIKAMDWDALALDDDF